YSFPRQLLQYLAQTVVDWQTPRVGVVVGEKPKDTFRNIKFEEMKLEELEKKSKEVDGFLIMKDHFQEASTEQYKNVFSSLKKPVFFIGLQDKSYSIFITKGIEYNSARKDVNAISLMVRHFEDQNVAAVSGNVKVGN
ncbi:hypothetical protein ACT4UM_29135, partial [Bacillus sp. SS-TM]